MIAIDDPGDPRLADYQLVAQPDALRARGLFVAEGRLILPRVLDAPRFHTRSILLTMTAWASVRGDIERSTSTAPVYVIPQDHMNRLVGFNIHRGCLALVERPALARLADLDLSPCRRIVVLEGVNNPDNVGGLFRNAAAFDVDLVVLGPRCGDPFYRKAIRTSMGATLGVPIAEAGAWPDALATLRAQGMHVIALTPDTAAVPLTSLGRPEGRPLRRVEGGPLRGIEGPPLQNTRVALLLGAEGEGLSAEALAAADVRARIEMSSNVDSLNVATAAAVALHHFAVEPHGR